MAVTTIEQAQQAVALQAKIDTILDLQARAQQAKDNHWLISTLMADTGNAGERPLITAPLDDAASQMALDYCLGVYAQMLTALTAQRDALLA